ncbi:MAG TPA: hypothetical protein V6C97_34170 [Oculatellaceae cyanobacterium]
MSEMERQLKASRDDVVGRAFEKAGNWMADEIQGILRSSCEAVKQHNQPCTTRGWMNAVLDASFYEDKGK